MSKENPDKGLDTKLRAKEYLIKSKLYRFFALIFGVSGFVYLSFSYYSSIEQGGKAFQDVMSLLLPLFPLLPAVVFSFMAKSAEKKVNELMKDPKES